MPGGSPARAKTSPSRALTTRPPQISTTKGTGGDLIVLEEAAYVDPGFFYVSLAGVLLFFLPG